MMKSRTIFHLLFALLLAASLTGRYNPALAFLPSFPARRLDEH